MRISVRALTITLVPTQHEGVDVSYRISLLNLRRSYKNAILSDVYNKFTYERGSYSILSLLATRTLFLIDFIN